MQEPKKTRTKAFRFEVSLIEKLGRASKRAHLTENAFVSALLEDKLLIDPLIPAFQEIRLAGITFQSMHNSLWLASRELLKAPR
jgi:hypothetical protein